MALNAVEMADATQAQRAAVNAQQDAVQAQAPRLAAAAFGTARNKHTDGDTLLGQNSPAAAKQRFGEAQQLYREATQQAREAAQQAVVAAIAADKTNAEQARGQMDAARRSAEQASAEKLALPALNAGRAKDRDGQTAFGRAEYGPASRLFREAQRAYEDAKKEADAVVAVNLALKTDTEQARRAVTARRDDAVKAEAPRLAKPSFDAAQQKQSEADGLAGRESYAEATQAYKDAAERYRDAASRASIARELRTQADSARDRMTTEKQRARESAPDFASAQAEEKLAMGLYERLEYKGAAEKFKAAEGLYARSALSAVPPGPTKAPEPAAPPPPKPSSRPPGRPLPPSF